MGISIVGSFPVHSGGSLIHFPNLVGVGSQLLLGKILTYLSSS